MKRIAFVCTDINIMGGVEHVTRQLAERMKEDYEVHIISLYWSSEKNTAQLSDEIRLHRVKKAPFRRAYNMGIDCWSGYRKILMENDFDCCILQGGTVSFWGLLMKAGISIPCITCDHGTFGIEKRDLKYDMIRHMICHLTDREVVLTKQTRRMLQEGGSMPVEKIRWIPNWISNRDFQQAGLYDLQSKVMISAGRFSTEKRFETIPAIASIVFQQCPDWQWHIYGDGVTKDLIQEEIKKYHMEKYVILMGMDEQLKEKYRNYGMFVLTSQNEGLPLVLLEAKVNHLPIVSYDISTGPADIVISGVNGFLVESQNISQMAERIITLIENPVMRESFSQHSYDNIDCFREDSIYKEWRDLLEDTI